VIVLWGGQTSRVGDKNTHKILVENSHKLKISMMDKEKKQQKYLRKLVMKCVIEKLIRRTRAYHIKMTFVWFLYLHGLCKYIRRWGIYNYKHCQHQQLLLQENSITVHTHKTNLESALMHMVGNLEQMNENCYKSNWNVSCLRITYIFTSSALFIHIAYIICYYIFALLYVYQVQVAVCLATGP
jgi:hypothetical protein